EDIAHRVEFDVLIGEQSLPSRAGAATTATDETDLEGITTRRVNNGSQAQFGRQSRTAYNSRGFQEVAPRRREKRSWIAQGRVSTGGTRKMVSIYLVYR